MSYPACISVFALALITLSLKVQHQCRHKIWTSAENDFNNAASSSVVAATAALGIAQLFIQ